MGSWDPWIQIQQGHTLVLLLGLSNFIQGALRARENISGVTGDIAAICNNNFFGILKLVDVPRQKGPINLSKQSIQEAFFKPLFSLS